MKQKIIISGLIIFIIITIAIIVTSLTNYNMKINTIVIHEMTVKGDTLELSIAYANSKGYFKEIKEKEKKGTKYIYFKGTQFKHFRNKKINTIEYKYTVNIKDINKVYISDGKDNKIVWGKDI